MKKQTVTIFVKDYPQSFSFIVNGPLPEFKYGCETRRKLLVKAMRFQNVDSPSHGYDEYVVEQIASPSANIEHWYLGS